MRTILTLLAVFNGSAFAQSQSSSPTYTLTHDSPGNGGGSVSSATYAAQTSNAAVAVGDSSSAGIADRSGYTGQLRDPRSFLLDPTILDIDEGTTKELGALAILDDLTTLQLDPADVAWTLQSGPLSDIDSFGLATAELVYQDTTAQVSGSWLGRSSIINLTVNNTGNDDFGSYAGDAINDDWQVAFFGVDNPDAAPERDPDGDAQDNLLEFLALVDPTDPESIFEIDVRPTPGQPGKHDIVFSPLASGRSYVVTSSTNLDGFLPLTGATSADDAGTRTVTDHNTTAPRQFYKVEITNP